MNPALGRLAAVYLDALADDELGLFAAEPGCEIAHLFGSAGPAEGDGL
jgi:hypothetical protein